jgi:hypothetical protein
MKEETSSFSRQADEFPYQSDPYIRQYEGYTGKQESYHRIFDGSPYTACVFQSAGCFSAEPFPVIIMNSPPRSFSPIL